MTKQERERVRRYAAVLALPVAIEAIEASKASKAGVNDASRLAGVTTAVSGLDGVNAAPRLDDTPSEQSDREAALRRWRGLDELAQPFPDRAD